MRPLDSWRRPGDGQDIRRLPAGHRAYLPSCCRLTLLTGEDRESLGSLPLPPPLTLGSFAFFACSTLAFRFFYSAVSRLLGAGFLPEPFEPVAGPLLRPQFLGIDQFQLVTLEFEAPAELERLLDFRSSDLLDMKSAGIVADQSIESFTGSRIGSTLNEDPGTGRIRVPLENFPVLRQLLHGEVTADMGATFVFGETPATALVGACCIVPTLTVRPQLYGLFVTPAMFACFSAQLGHPAMEMPPPLVGCAATLGGGPLLTPDSIGGPPTPLVVVHPPRP